MKIETETDQTQIVIDTFTGHLDRFLSRHTDLDDVEAFIDDTTRRVATKKHLKRTGRYVPRNEIHKDEDACDLYSMGWISGLEAWKEHDETRPGGMGLHPFILWHIWKTANDASWFRAAASVPKWVIYPLLALADLHDDQDAKRLAWIEMGYSASTFDNVDALTKPEQVRMEIFSNDFCNGVEVIEKPAQGAQVVDPEFEGQLRLFETADLTPTEQKIWSYKRWGYSNSFIADTLIASDAMMCDGTPEARARKVSILHRAIKAKAQKFFAPKEEEDHA
jgi:hypothetical protein